MEGVMIVGMGEIKTDSGMKCPAEECGLKEGDIITYVAKDGSIVTHRIFLKGTTEDKNASAFVMKGDYNTSIDQDPISYNQVVGLYKGRIAGIGGVANFLQSPIGVIVVLGLPLACILIIDLIKKKKISAHTIKTIVMDLSLIHI